MPLSTAVPAGPAFKGLLVKRSSLFGTRGFKTTTNGCSDTHLGRSEYYRSTIFSPGNAYPRRHPLTVRPTQSAGSQTLRSARCVIEVEDSAVRYLNVPV